LRNCCPNSISISFGVLDICIKILFRYLDAINIVNRLKIVH